MAGTTAVLGGIHAEIRSAQHRRSGNAGCRRPDRHHHPQPPRGLQLDRSCDREKARAVGAQVEADNEYPGAGDPRRRPRVLRRRRPANHRRRRRSRHHRARGRRTAEALSRLHRDPAADAEDRADQRARLGRRRRNGTGLCRRPLHRRRRCPLHAGLRQNWRVARRRQHGRHGRHRRDPARAADISGRRQLFRPAGL